MTRNPKTELAWHELQIAKLVSANFSGAGQRIKFHSERAAYWREVLKRPKRRLHMDEETGATVLDPPAAIAKAIA